MRGECGIEIVGETELGRILSFSLNLVYLLSVMCPQVCHRMVTFVLQPCLVLPYEDAALCQPRPRLLQLLWGNGILSPMVCRKGLAVGRRPLYGPLMASMTAGFPHS